MENHIANDNVFYLLRKKNILRLLKLNKFAVVRIKPKKSVSSLARLLGLLTGLLREQGVWG